MTFDFAPLLRQGLPVAAQRWGGFPRYNFVGGHNDAASVPSAALSAAAQRVIEREGGTLATYGLESGSQGYLPLREFVAKGLQTRTKMTCASDDVLIVSGSLQALDLVNDLLIEPGDTVVVEAATYGGAVTRLRARGAVPVGVELDGDGMRMDSLEEVLTRLDGEGRRPKFIYTIPTVQNPTGSVMPEGRRREMLALAKRFGVPIFEDDCYAELLWDGERPPAIRALDDSGMVIYCGSFSKTIAPALRVGYLVADWPVMSRMLPLKTDGGTGALAQMILAEYAAEHFDSHVAALTDAPQIQVRRHDRGPAGRVRHGGRVHRAQGRHLHLGDPARGGRHIPAGGRGGTRRGDLEPGGRVGGGSGDGSPPPAALLRQPDRGDDSRGSRQARRDLPPRNRPAPAQRQRGPRRLSWELRAYLGSPDRTFGT